MHLTTTPQGYVLRPSGDRHAVAMALTYLGNVLHDRGKREAARTAWREALDLFERIGAPDAAEVRAYLK